MCPIAGRRSWLFCRIRKKDMSPMATSPCMKASCSAPMDAPTAADRIRNPGYRPTYSYGLAHPISKNSLMRGMVHSWLPSGTFIVKEGGNR